MPDPNRAFSPSMYWMGHIATLVSIFAIFVTLSVAFLWRASNPQLWKPIHLPDQLSMSTVLLLCASASMEMARHVAKKRGPMQAYTSWLIRTGIFGLAFVVTQALCWKLMLGEAAGSASSAGFFYVLTAAHAAHVLLGMCALSYLLWRVWHPWATSIELRRITITTMLATYWHFMGFIWIGLYAILYAKSA
ncbi:MAG TPA: cytochrome c oxidase subunit 3 [Bryobacteraceae bacterium]|jgi:cytochrome c oxidase subunit 3